MIKVNQTGDSNNLPKIQPEAHKKNNQFPNSIMVPNDKNLAPGFPGTLECNPESGLFPGKEPPKGFEDVKPAPMPQHGNEIPKGFEDVKPAPMPQHGNEIPKGFEDVKPAPMPQHGNEIGIGFEMPKVKPKDT